MQFTEKQGIEIASSVRNVRKAAFAEPLPTDREESGTARTDVCCYCRAGRLGRHTTLKREDIVVFSRRLLYNDIHAVQGFLFVMTMELPGFGSTIMDC